MPPELGPSPLARGELNLSVADARAAISAVLKPITDHEELPLEQALGRILAQDVVSPIDVPAHDNSAMDGYGFDGAFLKNAAKSVELRVVGTVFAGAPFDGKIGPGEAVRIMTGAVMPAGLDTVVPQELTSADADRVRFDPSVIRQGENRRKRGEDLKAGQAALTTGRILKPSDMGLIGSLGVGRVRVMRKLRVAMFSTGNELRAIGQALDAGSVYDSNRYTLLGALQRLGFEVIDLGIVKDDPQALEATLHTALEKADVVVTSGGVSAGEADFTRDLLDSLGQFSFWKVAMRPGRPFAFGSLRRPTDERPAWLFALPGNPVGALVTFYVLAREALLTLAGATPEPLPTLKARSLEDIRKRPGRTEYQRAIVEPAPDGGWQVRSTGSQGAGILRSMSQANALMLLRHEQASVKAGDMVEVWLFDGLV